MITLQQAKRLCTFYVQFLVYLHRKFRHLCARHSCFEEEEEEKRAEGGRVEILDLSQDTYFLRWMLVTQWLSPVVLLLTNFL